jgi:hypothetical protein
VALSPAAGLTPLHIRGVNHFVQQPVIFLKRHV